MTKTTDNLSTAFAGESQANRRYLAFAKKADEEGYSQAAKLFRAAAHAETVHALNHLKAWGEVRSTAENLQAAVRGEHYEAVSMYPPFVLEAEGEGHRTAQRSFQYALEAEKVHEALYQAALDTLGKSTETGDYYVCPICGYTHLGTPPEKCPVCNTLAKKFERIS